MAGGYQRPPESLWLQYDEVIDKVYEVETKAYTLDLSYMSLVPRTIRMNGVASLVDQQGLTKFDKRGLQLRVKHPDGSSSVSPIRVTGEPAPGPLGVAASVVGSGGAAGPGGVGAGAAAPAGVKRNFKNLAPTLKEVTAAELVTSDGKSLKLVEGTKVFRIGSKLFVDSEGIVEQLNQWRTILEGRMQRAPGDEVTGPPPLFIIGLIKTGKTFVLTKVLPAVMAGSPVFGIKEAAGMHESEARVITLDLAGLPVHEGFQSMLRFMTQATVAQMTALGMQSYHITRVARALALPNYHLDHLMFVCLFSDLPTPVILLIDEVHNLLQPRKPGSRDIDYATQHSAGLLLKMLVTAKSRKLMVAVTGSSMAAFMLQVGKIPTNGTAVLPHARLLCLPSKHEPALLQFAAKDALEHWCHQGMPSAEEIQVLLRASQNVAFMLTALEVYLSRAGRSTSDTAANFMRTFLARFTHTKMLLEGLNEWGVTLRGFTPAQRRSFLNIALTSHGLSFWDLPVGLETMLLPLTSELPGTSPTRYILTSSFHRSALQLLIRPDGSINEKLDFLPGNTHTGWVDAFLHFLEIGNRVERWLDAKQMERATELLQEPAQWLTEKQGDATTWHAQPWFQAVLLAEANQGTKGGVPKECLAEVTDPNSAAFRYKEALETGELSAGGHLAHYTILLRNVLAHSPPSTSSASAPYAPEPTAADLGSAAMGDQAEVAADPVDVLQQQRSGGFAEQCAQILMDSPVADPLVEVADRFVDILRAPLPQPPQASAFAAQGEPAKGLSGKGSSAHASSGSSASLLRHKGGTPIGLVSGQPAGASAGGIAFMGGGRCALGPKRSGARGLASPLRPARTAATAAGRGGGAHKQPVVALRRVTVSTGASRLMLGSPARL